MKWTPGPWKADGTTIYQDAGIQVHIAYCHGTYPLTDNAEANAHLIAASPTMYEALQRMVETFTGRTGLSMQEQSVIDAAVAALAKANGKE